MQTIVNFKIFRKNCQKSENGKQNRFGIPENGKADFLCWLRICFWTPKIFNLRSPRNFQQKLFVSFIKIFRDLFILRKTFSFLINNQHELPIFPEEVKNFSEIFKIIKIVLHEVFGIKNVENFFQVGELKGIDQFSGNSWFWMFFIWVLWDNTVRRHIAAHDKFRRTSHYRHSWNDSSWRLHWRKRSNGSNKCQAILPGQRLHDSKNSTAKVLGQILRRSMQNFYMQHRRLRRRFHTIGIKTTNAGWSFKPMLRQICQVRTVWALDNVQKYRMQHQQLWRSLQNLSAEG